jgi:hypothetical protein
MRSFGRRWLIGGRTCLSSRASRCGHGTGCDLPSVSPYPAGEGPGPEAIFRLDLFSQQYTTTVRHCCWVFCAADAATSDVAALLQPCGRLRRRHLEPQRAPGTLPTFPCATIPGDRRTGTKGLCVGRVYARAAIPPPSSQELQNWPESQCCTFGLSPRQLTSAIRHSR